MNLKKRVCLMILLVFTASASLAFAGPPAASPTKKTTNVKTIDKRHNETGVLVEPTAVPKIPPKRKTKNRSRTSKTIKKHNHAAVLVDPDVLE